ncbi:25070_t:CDS:2, partial [Cetraspora pellucida]
SIFPIWDFKMGFQSLHPDWYVTPMPVPRATGPECGKQYPNFTGYG